MLKTGNKIQILNLKKKKNQKSDPKAEKESQLRSQKGRRLNKRKTHKVGPEESHVHPNRTMNRNLISLSRERKKTETRCEC